MWLPGVTIEGFQIEIELAQMLGFETIREMKFASNGADFAIMGKRLQTA